jgi:hypothetical protein
MTTDGSPATTREDESHVGERPTWTCRVCSDPWPCVNARRELRVEFRWFPSAFKIYMTAQMFDAAADLEPDGGGPSADLYERFLAWFPIPTERPT